MRFGNAQAGYFLWIVALLIVFYVWAFKRRRKAMESFAQKELLPFLTPSVDIGKRKVKVLLTSVAILMCFIALIRPQWGFQWQEVKRKGLDILIAIDTSKSMLAVDVKPNRLERSKLAVRDLIKKLRGDRIGLIAFSGKAFSQCPLTIDYNGFSLALDDLGVNTIPKGGTSISSAIQEAVKVYENTPAKYKILVLITDGENHEGNPVKAAEQAKQEGIKIFCIGIGTKEGELVPVPDGRGGTEFLKDKNDKPVKSKLDENTLKEIAAITGGAYVKAAGAEFGLDLIYEQQLSKMEKREIETKMQKHYEERFQIPLMLALLLLLIEPFLNEKKKTGKIVFSFTEEKR